MQMRAVQLGQTVEQLNSAAARDLQKASVAVYEDLKDGKLDDVRGVARLLKALAACCRSTKSVAALEPVAVGLEKAAAVAEKAAVAVEKVADAAPVIEKTVALVDEKAEDLAAVAVSLGVDEAVVKAAVEAAKAAGKVVVEALPSEPANQESKQEAPPSPKPEMQNTPPLNTIQEEPSPADTPLVAPQPDPQPEPEKEDASKTTHPSEANTTLNAPQSHTEQLSPVPEE